MTTENQDPKPDNVSTEDAPRPPDNTVVTSDLSKEAEPQGQKGQSQSAAASTDDPNSPGSATGDPKDPAPKRNTAAERRIKKLSARLAKAEQKSDERDRKIAELEAQNRALAETARAVPEPRLEDFKEPREYAKAHAKWEKNNANALPSKTPTKATPPATAEPPAESQPELPPKIKAFHEAGKQMLGEEFAEALEETSTAISQTMAEFLFESEVGPAVYVHLSNNQEHAREIFDMSPRKVVEALGKLEDKATKGELDIDGQLQIAPNDNPDEIIVPGSGTDGKKAKAPSKKSSKATPPPSGTKETGGANLEPNPENEGMEDYAARRRKEEAQRAGRILN